MGKKIFVSESQFKRLYNMLNEEVDTNPIFQTDYDSEKKTIRVSYYILEEKPESFRIINPIEIQNSDAVYADDFVPYHIKLNVVDLPKSQVSVVGETDGYTIFEIPYWLYKKNNDLRVRRIPSPMKRTDARTSRSDMYSKYDTETLMKIIEPLGGDLRKVKTYSTAFENLKNKEQ